MILNIYFSIFIKKLNLIIMATFDIDKQNPTLDMNCDDDNSNERTDLNYFKSEQLHNQLKFVQCITNCNGK